MQRVRIGFISSLLSVIILLTAAFTNAAPLSAIAMNEGRTYDQAHNTGYIDWSGSAQYVVVTHRDGSSLPPEEGGASCGSSCTEWVTRLGNGGMASGAFDRDVSYLRSWWNLLVIPVWEVRHFAPVLLSVRGICITVGAACLGMSVWY